jgi:hypothetical protein
MDSTVLMVLHIYDAGKTREPVRLFEKKDCSDLLGIMSSL